MAKAATTSSGPATTRRAGTLSTTDEIDAATIRDTFSLVLGATHPVPFEDQERIGGLLLGHVQLLVPELAAAVPRLRGEWRGAAEHVLASTRRMLAAGPGSSPDDLNRMATQCRALLSLRQHAAPLTCLVARTTESPCS